MTPNQSYSVSQLPAATLALTLALHPAIHNTPPLATAPASDVSSFTGVARLPSTAASRLELRALPDPTTQAPSRESTTHPAFFSPSSSITHVEERHEATLPPRRSARRPRVPLSSCPTSLHPNPEEGRARVIIVSSHMQLCDTTAPRRCRAILQPSISSD